MRGRKATVFLLTMGLAAAAAGPSRAQQTAPPRLTFTPRQLDLGAVLFGVSFVDGAHGHVVGAYHSVFGTADGGETWVREPTPLPSQDPSTVVVGEVDVRNQSFTAVSFPESDHGFAVSGDDAVIATADGGRTWVRQATPRPATVGATWPDSAPPLAWSFNGVSFTSPTHGHVVGYDGLILGTADGGTTWTYQGDPRYGVLTDVSFSNDVHGYAVGQITGRPNQIVYTSLLTTDGSTWRPAAGRPRDGVASVNLSSIAVTGPTHAVAVGQGGRIFATFDAGKTWRNTRNGTNERLAAVAFADDGRRGVAVGAVDFQGELRALILATADRGLSWTAFPAPGYGDFSAVDFADSTTAFAVGCVEHTSPCRQAAVLKIGVPPVELEGDRTGGSQLPVVPLVLLGGALLVVATGIRVAVRRR